MFEFLSAIMASGLFAWVFFVCICVLLIIAIDNRSNFGATAIMIGAGFGAWLFFGFNVITWIPTHFFSFLLYAFGYVAIGIAYTWLKWISTYKHADRKFSEWRTDNLSVNKIDFPDRAILGYTYPLKFSDHKFDALMWMMYWPISGLWTLLNDPVHRMFVWIRDNIGNTLQRMADNSSEKVYK